MAFRDPMDSRPLSPEDEANARGCASVLLVVALLVGLGRAAAWLWNWLAERRPPSGWGSTLAEWIQAPVVLLAIAVAAGLYALRQRLPRVYASLEFFVACSTAWVAVSAERPLDEGLKFAAAVYLMVRSFDNWWRKPTATKST